MERRKFLQAASLASIGMAVAGMGAATQPNKTSNEMTDIKRNTQKKRFRPHTKVGMGGVALGNGFAVHPDIECIQTVEAAWNAGVRYFDTSPWYGLGLSERRMGMFLKNKKREDFVLSTKVGRMMIPHEDFKHERGLWKGKLNFSYRYDYTADGVRRSVEDSLQRLGVSSLDIVYIHDLSPDNGDMKEKWLEYFDIAQKGAMPALTKMREEGLIKAWGLGVNTIEPILKTLEVADPDIFLSACQYNLIKHDDLLNKVFPIAAKRAISLVIGSPLCAGFLSGKDRYLYGGDFPAGVKDKLAALKKVADDHHVDLRTVALQFCAVPEIVSGVIPGSHTVEQAEQNAASLLFREKVPAGFWAELKSKELIAAGVPVPAV